jgi:asparagine synthase (glutamine-hydrolysing)
MGNFFVVINDPQSPADGARLFERGITCGKLVKGQASVNTHETSWVRAAHFHRANGNPARIAVEPETGSFLLAAGSWFHSSGIASGDETGLLNRFLRADTTDVARELDGFFCIVFADARTQGCAVITDVAGSHHAFMRAMPGGLAISGSSLLLAALVPVAPDPIGCQEFLETGVIYEDRTAFRDVRKLFPASIYRYVAGVQKERSCYWDVLQLEPDSLGGERAAGALWESLCDAARRIGRVYPRIVCDLTGGYDSRAIAAALRGAGVSFTATVSGPADSADVQISTGLATRLGIPHLHSRPAMEPTSTSELFDALVLTDGEYDLMDYARIARVHRELMARFDVSINGSYGELARGYWWELLAPRTGARAPLNATRVAARRYGALPYDPSLVPREGRVDLIQHLVGVIKRTNAGLESRPNTLQMDHAYLRMRMQRWQGRIASTTDQLWPCISPFMFRHVLEAMLTADTRLRNRSLLIRQMLARFQPDMAAFPLEHGYPALPASWRTLPRFTPLIRHYAARVANKLSRKLGLRTGAAPPRAASQRALLWRDDKVTELLDPARMRLADLIETQSLADFLARSRRESFAFEDSWRRVLTLECALRAVEQCGNQGR